MGSRRDVVLDDNHGIQRVTQSRDGSGVAWTDGETRVVYIPWYYTEANGVSYYYTSRHGQQRVECSSWITAFNHIARSRRMLTSKYVGSNYAQEAENAGITLG